MENREIALKAAAVLDNKKALDVVVIDIAEKSAFADYFVIASGGTDRQVKALSEEVEDEFAKLGILVKNVEGRGTSGWLLMDFGDIIVNVFTVEQRERYHIEKVWGDCEFLSLDFE